METLYGWVRYPWQAEEWTCKRRREVLLEVINSIERTPSQETTKRTDLHSLSIMFDSDIPQSRNFSLHSGYQRSLLPHIFTSFCIASAKWREGSFELHRQKFSIQFHCYLLLFSSKLCICTTVPTFVESDWSWIFTLSIFIIHYVNGRKSLPGCK